MKTIHKWQEKNVREKISLYRNTQKKLSGNQE